MNKQNLIKIFIIILFVLSIILILFPIRIQQTINNASGKETIGLIKKNDVLTQHINIDVKDMNKIGIWFSTYGVKNKNGVIEISLTQDNKLIKKKNINLKDIIDNSWQFIEFPSQKKSSKLDYKLTIKYKKYYKGDSLTIWTNSSIDEKNYLELNNKNTNSSLYYNIRGKKKNYDFLLYDIILFGLSLIVYSFKVGGKNEKDYK